jgi:D-3-phosphoglycerate dehydrogenase
MHADRIESPRVLLLETIDPRAHELLDAGAEVVLSETPNEVDCLHAASAGPVHAIMTRGKGRVTPALLDACNGLVCAARCGVGLDNVDVPAATARGIRVLNLPGCNAQTMAEHTIALMLAVTRGVVNAADSVTRGHWADRAAYDRDEANGKTIGIVGLGNIGARVAGVCDALRMQVVYADPISRDVHYPRLDLPDLLATADIVTLHCALTDATRGMIDAGAIARLKPGAILVNTARGAIVDQDAVARALHAGHLAGYAADVLETEPPTPDDPLLHASNVVITPHVGSLTRSTYREICVESVRNVLRVLDGDDASPGTLFNAGDLT